MADVLPSIQISPTDGLSRDGTKPDSPVLSPTKDIVNGTKDGRPKSGVPEIRLAANGKSYSSKLIRNLSNNPTEATGQNVEGRMDSQTAIDPLSHHILKRTHTQSMVPQKLRNGVLSEGDSGASEAAAPGTRGSSEQIIRSETPGPGLKDKRKGSWFLSRIIGSKKKEMPTDANDDDSEVGDKRTEGTDADVFSQPIGFIPRYPAPPKYIKVRSHGKKEKDFNRVFLAQELRGRSGLEIAQAGGRLVKNGAALRAAGPKKEGNAVWAMEFSKDGKYLAAGGQDYAVRVWQVISTAEDRHAHETEEDAAGKEGESVRLNAPVFKTKTVQEYGGHIASILDLSWSKNNFLLSSSMDKTVRLWHVTRTECLCCFKHSDFVTSIQFHPRDDRFFLAGSLDSKLRLWSIPDKSVAFWNQLPDLITAVAFSSDGKTAIAGCLNGLCLFYETEGLKYQTQIHVRSAHGKNAKGSKVTGIQAINYPPDDPNGEVKLLVTSNDSRVRVYNLRDKGLEIKLKGNENSCSQIHASFSDDARYVICGSEDRKAYIWSTGPPETENDKRPVEMFEAHSAIVTTAIMAPVKTRQLLSASGDPIYDLCNPPPVTLVSRTESHASSQPPTEGGRTPDLGAPPITPATNEFDRASTKPEETPAYIARCAHLDGNIIVTADYVGHIKVFRQDCAYQKRFRTDLGFSKKMLGRTNSAATRNSKGSRRNSLHSNQPSSDRILSWRQSITNNNPSIDNIRSAPRSVSPRKSLGQASVDSFNKPSPHQPPTSHPRGQSNRNNNPPSLSTTSLPPSIDHSPQGSKSELADGVRKPYEKIPMPDPEGGADPLMLYGDHSYMFWNKSLYRAQANSVSRTHLQPNGNNVSRGTSIDAAATTTASSANSQNGENGHADERQGVPIARKVSTVSALSSEEGDGSEGEEVRCRRCGGKRFKVVGKEPGRRVECGECGEVV